MCGITGIVDFRHKTTVEELKSMTSKLGHRGPDSAGTKWFISESYQLGLGHRRLSILDLSGAGHQPMQKHDNWISYNGEIYNFQAIKDKLIARGIDFSSNSDTEVLLSAYEEWGIDCLDELEGMFAFVIYDIKKKILFIARDRAGMKPFYYYLHNDLFLFSSELKAFHEIKSFKKEISNKGLSAYFQNGYIPSPYTIFNHTHKLQQGQYGILDLESTDFQLRNYWTVNSNRKTEIKLDKEEEVIEHTENLLIKSCMSHMVSDVPVGVFLSGGYDSSTVSAIIQKNSNSQIKTFTIGFEDAEYNEAPYAKQVAEYLVTDHIELICKLENAKQIIPQLAEIYDEPFSDYSAIPTYLLSQLTRDHVKVVLSADGGDELFVGYRRFINSIKLAKTINKFPKSISKTSGKVLSLFQNESFGENYIKRKLSQVLRAGDIHSIPIYQNQKILSKDLEELLIHAENELKLNYHISEDINDIFRIEYQQYLQDEILVKVDRASMAVGLEAREPLLDHNLVEWAIKLPISIKQKDGELKHLLKAVAHKYVPKELLDRPKQGFNIPIMDWIRNDMNYLLADLLDSARIKKQGIFTVKTIELVVSRFLKGNDVFYDKLVWQLIVFQMWYQKWMT